MPPSTIVPSAALISRAAFESVGGFDERLVGYEDDDLFLRMFRSLQAIVGNDHDAQTWLRSENLALGSRPLELIRSAEGLVRVLHYLDASRARL